MIGSYKIHKDKLTGDYLKKFNYVERFGQRRKISKMIMAEKMMDLIDMLLQAQENDTPAENITGKDIDEFCRNYYSDIPVTEIIKNPINSLKSILLLLLGMSMVSVMTDPGNITDLKFNAHHYLSGFIAGFYVPLIINFIADVISLITKSYSEPAKTRIIHYLKLICSVLFIVIFMPIAIKNDLKIPFPAPALLLISGTLLIAGFMVSYIIRCIKSIELSESENEYVKSFEKLLEEKKANMQPPEFDKKVIQIYAQRYRQAARKYRKKKGKRLTTEKHFKDLKRKNALNILLFSFAGLVIGILIFNLTFHPEFSAPEDHILYYSIIGALFIGIQMFMMSTTRQARNVMDKILAECRKQNVEIDSYYKILSREKNRK